MNPTPIIFTTVRDLDNTYITVYGPEGPRVIDDSHPNFTQIVKLCNESLLDPDIAIEEVTDLFDIPKAIERRFARLSERVSVIDGEVCLDGDPVNSTLTEQILTFMDEGEDFEPLVKFYEKLATNPLGDVRAGLFDWLKGQTSDGSKVTITADGDLIGYKGVWPSASGRGGVMGDGYFVPSRKGPGIVNGGPVDNIEQAVGDVVEMPRSTLSEPSMECGVGLHVGTYNYAKSFGQVCLIVRFNPRDVVSAPDRNSSWKLRVCRYKVVGIASEGAVSTGLFTDPTEDKTVDLDLTIKGDDKPERIEVGDEVIEPGWPDSVGTVVRTEGEDMIYVDYIGDPPSALRCLRSDVIKARKHGKGGPTSQEAKGNGRHPAQDSKGRFSAGRPGSSRDAKTGRFA